MKEFASMPEQREWRDQRAYHAFLSKALPVDAYHTAIDVGSAGSAFKGQLRKARGQKAGVPDYLVVHHGVTLWMEFKSGSSLSEPQKLTRDALRANGHAWALVRSLEDVEAACVEAGIPLRASVSAISGRIAEQRARLPAKRKAVPRTPGGPARMSVAQYRKLHTKGLL
jgi:hypothetical protein